MFLPVRPAWATDDRTTAFDQANRLYEQGKYPEAAAAYERLLDSGGPNATLYFNLGNAWYKAGRTGLAVAAYRRAQQLSPREPGLRFNLQFVRKAVSGNESPPGRWWQRALAALTLNEWTTLAGVAWWLWLALLALREWGPTLRKGLRGYTAAAGVVWIVLAGCLVAALQWETSVRRAVVVVPEAVVREGPFEDAKEVRKFRDGTEVEVVDRREIAAGAGRQSWLQVQDMAGRGGWVQSDRVLEVPPLSQHRRAKS